MIKNYFKVALRNLWKNKSFSAINILGLALGMICSLLIFLWVNDEKSMDSFHAEKDRLYNIYERQYYDGKVEGGFYTPGLLAQEMKKAYPEVEAAADYQFWDEQNTFQVGDKIVKEKGSAASDDFFKLFSFNLIKGNKDLALTEPANIVLSKTMAEKFFGSSDVAMGKTIRCENRKDYTVAGVYEDMPRNSSIKFEYLISWKAYVEDNPWLRDWGNNSPATTVLLKKGTDPEAFKKKITKFLDGFNKAQDKSFRIELGIFPFSQIYLHSNFKNGEISGGRIEYVNLFTVVAIFILCIACINFMNLTTARSVKRSKEIGIRKVIGAVRLSLIIQFIGEAVLIAFAACLIALFVLVLLLPAFNQLTGKQIILPVTSGVFWVKVLGLVLITGIVSGSYPALLLSSFNPIRILKGTLKVSTQSTFFRKGLVVFQFVLSIFLIIGTIIIAKQVKYIQTKNLGFDRENVISVPLDGELITKYEVLKENALKSVGIKSVTRMADMLIELNNSTGGVEWDGKDPSVKPMFTQTSVGYDFIKTMNIKLVAGRDFSKDYPTDSVGYLVNETALTKINYKDPVGQNLTFWNKKGKIIGVMKDFHFTSLHTPIHPLVLRFGEKEKYGGLLVKTQPGQTAQALATLENLCKELNPKFPFAYAFVDQEYQKTYKSEVIINKLCNYFSFLAIFISCLGLLGLAMFTAQQRMKEISIRKILGASVGSLFNLLSKEFLGLVCIALVIAIPIAWWAMNKWLENYAYRTEVPWWIFALAGMVTIVIALITVSFQAVKAALANPIKSLRTE